MNLRLVKASYDNQALVCDMMEEWYASGEHIVPWAITKTDCRDYDRFLAAQPTTVGKRACL